MLIGRTRIVERLLSEVETGKTPVVVVTGRPGSGRTSVLATLDARLRERDIATIATTATRYDSHTEFGLVERICLELGDPTDLTRLMAAPHSRDGSVDPSARLATALGDALLARGRLVVLVDDAQWAHPTTLALLAPLAKRLTGGQVTLVFGVRDRAGIPRSASPREHSALVRDRAVAVARLGPLSSGASATLIAETLGARPISALVAELRHLGGGAPGPILAAMEGYRASGALRVVDGDAHLIDTGAPPVLPWHAALFDDIRQLPETAREILMITAGTHRFGPAAQDLVVRCTESTAVDVAAVLSHARETGLLSSPDGAQPLFRPPLLAGALTHHLGPYITRRIARAVVSAVWDESVPCSSQEFFYDQVAVAGALVDRARAGTALLERGRTALASKPLAARRWLGAAAQLCEGEERMEALLKLARACWDLGECATAIGTVDALTEHFGDRLSPRAAQETQLIRIKSLRAVDDTEALAGIVSNTGRSLAGGAAQQQVTTGLALHSLGRYAESIDLLELTGNTWRPVGGMTSKMGHFVLLTGGFMLGRTDAHTFVDLYHTWPESDREKPHMTSSHLYAFLDSLLAAEDLDGARAVLAKAGRSVESLVGARKAVFCFLSGDWGENLDIARGHMAMGLASAPLVDQDVVYRALAQINLARAKPFSAMSLIEQARSAHSAEHHLLYTVQADVERLLGNLDTAADLVGTGLAVARNSELVIGMDHLWLRSAELAAPGDTVAVGRSVAETGAIADAVGTDSALLNHRLTRFIAERHDADAAEALRLTDRMGQPFTRAETISRLARFGGGTAARIQEAYETYGRLGALLPRANLRQIMRERGISVPGRKATVAEQQFVLATLVTEGLSNREAARLLHDTDKSVEGRLTRLFKQTGYRSRVELATAVLTGAFTVDSLA